MNPPNNVVPFTKNTSSNLSIDERAELEKLRALAAAKNDSAESIQAKQLAELERLRKENAALKAPKVKPLTFEVSKGKVVVKGLHAIGRGAEFTVSGIRRLIAAENEIEEFIQSNEAELNMFAP